MRLNYTYLVWQERTNYLFGFLFGVAALYQVAGIFLKMNGESLARTILFILINLYCVYGLFNRSKFFYLFYVGLTVYQLVTQSVNLVIHWNQAGTTFWISVTVLLVMTLGLAKLVVEYFTE
ncbi:MAG: hypothetical protein JNJ65_01690 [Cyclobacteriaceae bacterium]|nr:hypothetical protein [Cyclobacteriaceae bacterium]